MDSINGTTPVAIVHGFGVVFPLHEHTLLPEIRISCSSASDDFPIPAARSYKLISFGKLTSKKYKLSIKEKNMN